jgi:hypothetical protein
MSSLYFLFARTLTRFVEGLTPTPSTVDSKDQKVSPNRVSAWPRDAAWMMSSSAQGESRAPARPDASETWRLRRPITWVGLEVLARVGRVRRQRRRPAQARSTCTLSRPWSINGGFGAGAPSIAWTDGRLSDYRRTLSRSVGSMVSK